MYFSKSSALRAVIVFLGLADIALAEIRILSVNGPDEDHSVDGNRLSDDVFPTLVDTYFVTPSHLSEKRYAFTSKCCILHRVFAQIVFLFQQGQSSIGSYFQSYQEDEKDEED